MIKAPRWMKLMASAAKKQAIEKGHRMSLFSWYGEDIPAGAIHEDPISWRKCCSVCLDCGKDIVISDSFGRMVSGTANLRTCKGKR
jgi:hypothetical protein